MAWRRERARTLQGVPTWELLLIVLVTLVAMEPITYLAHRYVMHGVGQGWHISHHRRRRGRVERNDLYPVVFAVLTFALMLTGVVVEPLAVLLPIGIGITLYGLGYLFVHEVYIHRRFRRFAVRLRPFERLADAHALHHRFGGEPYGFLGPVVPRSIRRRAAEADAKGQSRPRQAVLDNEPHTGTTRGGASPRVASGSAVATIAHAAAEVAPAPGGRPAG
jgi:beta-carotene 3-hydroxylase